MKLPSIALLSDTILIAPFTKRLITSPRTVLPPTAITSPSTDAPALLPSNSISNTALSPTASVLGLAPGWE